jgi:hypothetical protein
MQSIPMPIATTKIQSVDGTPGIGIAIEIGIELFIKKFSKRLLTPDFKQTTNLLY